MAKTKKDELFELLGGITIKQKPKYPWWYERAVGRMGKSPLMFNPRGMAGSVFQMGRSQLPTLFRDITDTGLKLNNEYLDALYPFLNPDIFFVPYKQGSVGMGVYPRGKGGYIGVRGKFNW